MTIVEYRLVSVKRTPKESPMNRSKGCGRGQ